MGEVFSEVKVGRVFSSFVRFIVGSGFWYLRRSIFGLGCRDFFRFRGIFIVLKFEKFFFVGLRVGLIFVIVY